MVMIWQDKAKVKKLVKCQNIPDFTATRKIL